MKFLGFFYLENSHSSGFDIWANADLHGVLLQNWIFFKVPYDSIVTEIWRECWGCSRAHSSSCCLLLCLLLCTSAHTHTGAHIHNTQQVPAVMWDCMLQDADWNLCLCLLAYMSLCAWSRIRHSRMHPDHHIKTIMRRKVNIVLCHAPLTTAESIIVFIFKQLYLIKWNRPGTSITIMLLNINLGH